VIPPPIPPPALAQPLLAVDLCPPAAAFSAPRRAAPRSRSRYASPRLGHVPPPITSPLARARRRAGRPRLGVGAGA
jgi:hypothetical protein